MPRSRRGLIAARSWIRASLCGCSVLFRSRSLRQRSLTARTITESGEQPRRYENRKLKQLCLRHTLRPWAAVSISVERSQNSCRGNFCRIQRTSVLIMKTKTTQLFASDGGRKLRAERGPTCTGTTVCASPQRQFRNAGTKARCRVSRILREDTKKWLAGRAAWNNTKRRRTYLRPDAAAGTSCELPPAGVHPISRSHPRDVSFSRTTSVDSRPFAWKNFTRRRTLPAPISFR